MKEYFMRKENYGASIRTGSYLGSYLGSLEVPVSQVTPIYSGYNLEVYGKVQGEAFKEICITGDDVNNFIVNYAAHRKLVLLRNIPGYELALLNPRHNNILSITVKNGSINLLEFIEPEFITVYVAD